MGISKEEWVGQLVQRFWDLHMEAYRNFDTRNTEQDLEFYRGAANAYLKAYEMLDEIAHG